MIKLTIEEMREIAEKRNGTCLSDVYVGCNGKLLWKCNICGNIWKAIPGNIKFGEWCPECAGCKKLTIEQMREIAKERNGLCLSETYKDANEKLKWKCNACGNAWKASANNVKHGTWCPRCSHREKLTISQMEELAKSQGGECLSSTYTNSDTELLWKCGVCGEKWMAKPYNIKLGSWCPKCSGLKKKTIEDMRKLAKTRGGRCLSKKYVNCENDLLWECGTCGRTWKATPNNVNRGTWCPYCLHVGEETCRRIFKEIFEVDFPKVRPFWLINNKTGRKMELDGFNRDLKIAFEYNGLQHYSVVNLFHMSDDDLKRSIERDRLKEKLCKEWNITLVVVPSLRIKHEDFPYLTCKTLKQFVLDELRQLGIAMLPSLGK